MYPDKPISFVIIEKDEEGIHFGLAQNEKILSVISLFINGNSAQFRKFATLDSEQGKGYGTQLLRYLLEFCKQKNIETLWCNARSSKIDFYAKFGLQIAGKPYTVGQIEYIKLEISNL